MKYESESESSKTTRASDICKKFLKIIKLAASNRIPFQVITVLMKAFNKIYDDEKKSELLIKPTFAILVDHAMMIEIPNRPTSRLIFLLLKCTSTTLSKISSFIHLNSIRAHQLNLDDKIRNCFEYLTHNQWKIQFIRR